METIKLKENVRLIAILSELNTDIQEILNQEYKEGTYDERFDELRGFFTRLQFKPLLRDYKIITNKNKDIIIGLNTKDTFDYIVNALGSTTKMLQLIEQGGYYTADDDILSLSKCGVQTTGFRFLFNSLDDKDFFALMENTFTFE